ncbi:MAG TPA: N-acetylmuramoyl-L-alanine amidase, partial [Verrucomicrobiae bacterium]|nr:N-acetylmuramoyl-L-alanine amidase [Verrucomicrobiae bacterium]
MSYCRKLIWALALVILASCTTPPPRQTPPDVDLSPDQPVVAKPEVVVIKPPKAIAPAPAPTPAPLVIPPQDHIGPNEVWVPLERWCQACGYGAPRRIGNDPGPAYAFTLTNGTMTVRIGVELATWRGMDYHLGFAPELVNGHPYIHALDIRKNFLPLLENSIPLETNRVIVIDPGHGGTDTGTSNVANGHFEKEFTLDLARRLQALLAADGWTVLLTRTSDVYVSLPNRVAFAEQHKAGLFISLHFNSSFPDRQEAGLETYCLTPHGMRSTLTRGFADNPSLTFPNNNFDAENLEFAASVHREILKINGHLDRGLRRARFLGVLQGQNRPAFLVEGGYISNPTEARKIADPAYRQKLAEAIA